jgi:subtilase family serine protease
MLSLRAIFAHRMLAVLLFIPATISAQIPKDRVLESLDRSKFSPIKNSIHPLARAEYDQGRVDRSMPMRLTILFSRSAAQETDLATLLENQQERGSPDYQRWLTPEEFGRRFGMSQSDINKVTNWLEGEGFEVEAVPASRNLIAFRGTAQQVEAALHTEIHRYAMNGETHFANSMAPSVPTALSGIVLAVRGMNNFPLRPMLVRKAAPRFTSGITGKHFITPPDFAAIYSLAALYSQGITGSGQTIAVVGQSDINTSDVQAFRTASGLPNPSNVPQIVHAYGETPGMISGDIDEANLDVDWAGGIAYNATVIFVVGDPVHAGGVFDAFRYAVTNSPLPAPVISTSYGECEAFAKQDGFFTEMQTLAAQANAEGITILAPGGDLGAADCDINPSASGATTTASTQGLAVEVPASLPNVTAVGGTEFQEGADSGGQYWINPVCIGLPGCADQEPSAHGYIPEGAWNDTNHMISGVSVGLTAGGGGSSALVAKPAWQAGTGVPNDAARDVPDVSFSASPIQDPYLMCSEYVDPTTNQFTPWCTNGFRNSANNNQLDAVGGTSVGPPAMAAIVAMINEYTNRTSGSGNINPVLYPLAAHSTGAFNDIRSGNNQVPFSNACGTNTQIGYTAGNGYDLATGLGSINVSALISAWTSVPPASTGLAQTSADFSLGFSPASLTVRRGGCATALVELTLVNGFGGTPTFSCSVPAAIGGNLATPTTCAVTPAVATSMGAPGTYREFGWWGIAGLLLLGTAMAVITLRHPHPDDNDSPVWLKLAPICTAMALVAFAIGCGNSSSSAPDSPIVGYTLSISVPANAPVSSGTVNVTAASGTLSHTAGIGVTTQ